jgi:hypothetical protein
MESAVGAETFGGKIDICTFVVHSVVFNHFPLPTLQISVLTIARVFLDHCNDAPRLGKLQW